MPNWQFSLHYTDREKPVWSWSLWADDGSAMRRSASHFPNLDDCIADARVHGYTGHEYERHRLE